MTLIALSPSKEVERTFAVEDCPYETIMVDVTHRCNMGCRNCYLPNRTIPDLDAEWLSAIFARLPRGRYLRLAGAEPTMREDLPQLIRDARRHGHHPLLLTNGLKLADRSYVRELKQAGLQIVYLSFNGGFDDDLYEAIDWSRCATAKRAAFENLAAEYVYTSVGMIVVRGVNESAIAETWPAVQRNRAIREFHLRSIGPMGRYMKNPPFTLDELHDVFVTETGTPPESIVRHGRTATSQDAKIGRIRVQFTVWPDLGSTTRGRLTPEGTVAPAMEHMLANEYGY
jgi:molybdenum cofactor biosynthesis enzyme MoaA